jgi:glycosyltransferase involved in cell wall biosynthesis
MTLPSRRGPKTVLFINLYTEMGGGEYSIYYLVRELRKSEYRPLMLFNRRGPFVEKIEKLGISTAFLPYESVMLKRLIRPRNFRNALKVSRDLDRLLGESGVELIQCSDVLALMLVGLPALRRRIPVIYSFIFFYELPRIIIFNILALLFVKKIIANSERVRNDVVRRTFFLSAKVQTLYQGVDTDLFRPRSDESSGRLREELRVDPAISLVGMAGRFDPSKGQTVFLQAAAILLRKRSDLKFVLVGGLLNDDVIPSLSKYRKDVLRLAHELKIKEHLVFIPHRDDMPEVLRSLDVLVCPSVSEGFGLTVLEGLASGLPVVVSRCAGALEVAAGMEGVFVAEAGDAESFADRIDAALEQFSVRSHGPAARSDLLKHSWGEYSRQVERVYASVSNGGPQLRNEKIDG